MRFKHPHFAKSLKRAQLSETQRYQIEVALAFIVGFFLMFPYYVWANNQGYDFAIWQWYYVIPWMLLYTAYCLKKRSAIPRNAAVDPLKRPIIHWVLLGLVMIALLYQPINLAMIYSVYFAFGIFTLFFADANWDFKQ